MNNLLKKRVNIFVATKKISHEKKGWKIIEVKNSKKIQKYSNLLARIFLLFASIAINCLLEKKTGSKIIRTLRSEQFEWSSHIRVFISIWSKYRFSIFVKYLFFLTFFDLCIFFYKSNNYFNICPKIFQKIHCKKLLKFILNKTDHRVLYTLETVAFVRSLIVEESHDENKWSH